MESALSQTSGIGGDGITEPRTAASITSSPQIRGADISTSVAITDPSLATSHPLSAEKKLISDFMSLKYENRVNPYPGYLILPNRVAGVGMIEFAEGSIKEDIPYQRSIDLRKSGGLETASLIHDDFTTFHCFGRLPTELRLMVWKYTCMTARVVEIRCERRGTFERSYFRVYNNPPPAILHVNKEAREEGLNYYKSGSINDRQYPTYLNVDTDIILPLIDFPWHRECLGRNWTTFTKDHDSGVRKFKRMAVPLVVGRQGLKPLMFRSEIMGVQELVIVDWSPVDVGKFLVDTEQEVDREVKESQKLNIFLSAPVDYDELCAAYDEQLDEAIYSERVEEYYQRKEDEEGGDIINQNYLCEYD